MRSASSTTGSYLLALLCLHTNTVDEELSQEGAEIPKAERLWKQRKHSCGVEFVVVQSRDQTEWSTCSNTFSHCEIGRPRDFKDSCTPFQIISLYFSHWPFDLGLYTDVLLVEMRKLCKNDTISFETKDFSQSECMYPGVPNK